MTEDNEASSETTEVSTDVSASGESVKEPEFAIVERAAEAAEAAAEMAAAETVDPSGMLPETWIIHSAGRSTLHGLK
ncbi:MAG: hypothetical protein LUD51_01190 [Clostridia bacterium]|nr:hypothetical protein [Clostridia bacterium]